MLSLCLHTLGMAGIVYYMSPSAPELDSPSPVSITLAAPALSDLTPQLNPKPLPRPLQPPFTPVLNPQQLAPQPMTLSSTTTPLFPPTLSKLTLAQPARPIPVPHTPTVIAERLQAPTRPPSSRRQAAKRPAVARRAMPALKQMPYPSQTEPSSTTPHATANNVIPPRTATPPAPDQHDAHTATTVTSAAKQTLQPLAGKSHRQNVSQQQQPHFVYHPKPTYPLIARRHGWQGTVLLDLELLANGTVGKIKVAISSGYPSLDAAARKAVGKWRHVPVQRNGTPITKQANLPIHFRLD